MQTVFNTRKERVPCHSCSFRFKFTNNIHCKNESSQASINSQVSELQNTGTKQNLT